MLACTRVSMGVLSLLHRLACLHARRASNAPCICLGGADTASQPGLHARPVTHHASGGNNVHANAEFSTFRATISLGRCRRNGTVSKAACESHLSHIIASSPFCPLPLAPFTTSPSLLPVLLAPPRFQTHVHLCMRKPAHMPSRAGIFA